MGQNDYYKQLLIDSSQQEQQFANLVQELLNSVFGPSYHIQVNDSCELPKGLTGISQQELAAILAEKMDVLGVADKEGVLRLFRELVINDGDVKPTSEVMDSMTKQRIYDYTVRLNNIVSSILNKSATDHKINRPLISTRVDEPNLPFFTCVAFSESELRVIYGKLVWEQWIDQGNTTEDEFVYFFSGNGQPSHRRIRWAKSSVHLGFFLKEMTQDNRIWKVASKVVEVRNNNLEYYPIDSKQLCATYYNKREQENVFRIRRDVDSILRG